jgi:hypothetical protein
MTTPDTKITIGSYELKKPSAASERISGLIWGRAGAGKTTLAATAPGDLLWVNFDTDGTKALGNFDNIQELDLAHELPAIVERVSASDDNPFAIGNMLDEHPEFKTVVVDSVTSYADLALNEAVKHEKNATIYRPSLAGYGRRNTYTLRMIKAFLRMTHKRDINIIFICHEGTPDKNEVTGELIISVLLGGQLPELVPLQLSEVWLLVDNGSNREVHIRGNAMRKPMKTRMFSTSGAAKFNWTFNADVMTPDSMRIEQWIKDWSAADYRKIPLPK